VDLGWLRNRESQSFIESASEMFTANSINDKKRKERFMTGKISDSVVIITGASSGIGRAAALRLSRMGATVIIGSRRKEALERLAQSCERQGGKVIPVQTDVRDEQSVRALATTAIETFGRIDVWVNNAAVSLFARIEDAPLQDLHKVMETNFFGYVHWCAGRIALFSGTRAWSAHQYGLNGGKSRSTLYQRVCSL
jgi:NAD(P)-dependent dehydrogenase (short-subunit alcohol dehydrogenase family)